MNKDIKGLIKYLLFIFFVWLLPVGMFYCGLLSLSEHCSVYIVILALLLGLVLFILYIILPVVFTYKAMKYHWSKYLDKFFYNKYAPTILFVVLLLCALSQLIKFTFFSEGIQLFVLPYYTLIFLTILLTRLIIWCKSKYKDMKNKQV
ncbi:hypothetical protein KID03_06855 [bacterium]|uniref:Uncharacterized protein n=1 Tax=Candidatus Scatenecus faecavium TaxID=2840915 RepID=A0A9D1FVT4_9BACT|nr:hypothetical protein [bacterium]HIS82639.1 hypothetical protein [Candidatus Scatenecus faecavium]